MKLYIHYFVATLVVACCQIDGFHQGQEEDTRNVSIPRRTLTYTYTYGKKPIIEESIHNEDNAVWKFEADVLEKDNLMIAPAQSPDRAPNIVLKRQKNRPEKEMREFQIHAKTKTRKRKRAKKPKQGKRKLQYSDDTRDALIDALYDIESSVDEAEFEALLNIESGSQNLNSRLRLKTVFDVLARRSGSRSRSKGKGKGRGRGRGKGKGGKGKKKSYRGKGKGRYQSYSYSDSYSYSSSRKRRSDSRSRSRKSRKKNKKRSRSRSFPSPSRSESSPSRSESSPSLEFSANRENTFPDEINDFLNEYYSMDEKESADIEDVDDAFGDFLNNYYKFQEGKQKGNIDAKTDGGFDDYYVENGSPSGDYRDPYEDDIYSDDKFTTPESSPTSPKANKQTPPASSPTSPKANKQTPPASSPKNGKDTNVEKGKKKDDQNDFNFSDDDLVSGAKKGEKNSSQRLSASTKKVKSTTNKKSMKRRR